jgi:hypothetical protein
MSEETRGEGPKKIGKNRKGKLKKEKYDKNRVVGASTWYGTSINIKRLLLKLVIK